MGQQLSRALKKSANRIIISILATFAAIACCCVISGEVAYAAESTVTLSVTGTNDQADARTILTKVNSVRASSTNPNDGSNKTPSDPLTWDYELEKYAIQRAAELSIYWNHTRPDGTSCLDGFPQGYNSKGENIHVATGPSNATTANDGWTKSPGHYANMINKNFTCMAAASFKANGVSYWVELFGRPNHNTTATTAVRGTKTYSVKAIPSLLDISFTKTLSNSAAIGTSVQYAVTNANKGWPDYAKMPINPSSFTWTSSNPSAISVSSSGVATVKSKGAATISAKFKPTNAVALSKAVNSSNKKAMTSTKATTKNMSRTYTGSAIAPTITLKYGTTTLKNGTDYYLTYNGSKTAPKKVGSYTVRAVGKGNYTGTKTIGTYKIAKRSMASAKASASKMTQTATGKYAAPTVTVKYGKTTLKRNTDYYITYNGLRTAPQKAGNYTVKVIGMGNYSGTKTVGTFKLVKKATTTSFSSTKTYTICSVANTSFVLDAAGATPRIGANVSIWKKNGGKNQKWKLVSAGNGNYYIQSTSNSKFVLDAAGATPRIGANISIWTNNKGKNQQWKLEKQKDGTYIIRSAANSKFVLDAAGATPRIGANVSIWTANGGKNQKWVIKAA